MFGTAAFLREGITQHVGAESLFKTELENLNRKIQERNAALVLSYQRAGEAKRRQFLPRTLWSLVAHEVARRSKLGSREVRCSFFGAYNLEAPSYHPESTRASGDDY